MSLSYDFFAHPAPPQGDADSLARLAPEDRARYANLRPPATALEYLMTRDMRNPVRWIERSRADKAVRSAAEQVAKDIIERSQPRREPSKKRKPASRHIYFIQCGESGPVKIGIADNPLARLANLQTGQFETLRLLGYVRGTVADEEGWHGRFAEHNVRGEWFHPAPELMAAIKAAVA